jgi:hypothetical protein
LTVETFFLSGHVADMILAVMLVEGVYRSYRHSVTGEGWSPSRIFASLAPGACLVLALRAALTGAGWQWMALTLSLSGVAHAIDGWLRRLDRPPTGTALSEKTGTPPRPRQ